VKSVVRKNLIFIFWVICIIPLKSQVVYEHISRSNIYDFLDELANGKIIDLNSAVKPYSRAFIAGKLQEASAKQDQLTRRQQKEIEFYMKDYRLELQMDTRGMKPLNVFPKKEHLATALDPLVFITAIRHLLFLSDRSGESVISSTVMEIHFTGGVVWKVSPMRRNSWEHIPASGITTNNKP